MSYFIDIDSVTPQLASATALEFNVALSALESLQFFKNCIDAHTNCLTVIYENYPHLVRYHLERAREEYNTISQEDLEQFSEEIVVLEEFEANLYNKISTNKTAYDNFYKTQYKNISDINANLLKTHTAYVLSLDTLQKNIITTLSTSKTALALRQTVTSRLLTSLPLDLTYSKDILQTFVENNSSTLNELLTDVSPISSEIQAIKLDSVETFNENKSLYSQLLVSLKTENSTITTNFNSYIRNASINALRTRYMGVGDGRKGVLGYQYVNGELHNNLYSINGVILRFIKGLATRNNQLCNGFIGGSYYVDGFTTTLPSTGTGRWNNKNYVNGIVQQGSWSTGYYNTIPGVSSVEVMSPWIIQCAKDNNKWYNYYPSWPVSEIIESNKFVFTDGQFSDFNKTTASLPHYDHRVSDAAWVTPGSPHSELFTFLRLPVDNDLNIVPGSNVDMFSVPMTNGVIAHLNLLLAADQKVNTLRGATLYCQEILASILTAVSSGADDVYLQELYETFNSNRRYIVSELNQDGVSNTIKPILFHRKFSYYTLVQSSTSNIHGYNVPWAPINMSNMFEFEVLLGDGHNSDFSSPIIDVYSTYEPGVENISRTLSEIVSGDIFSDGSNVGLTPVLAKIINTYIPSITASLVSRYTTLCRSYSSTAPVYATGYVFLSGGREADLNAHALLGGVPDEVLGFSPYLSSWTAFQVDANGVAQPFTGKYTTINYTNTSIDLNFVNGEWAWELS